MASSSSSSSFFYGGGTVNLSAIFYPVKPLVLLAAAAVAAAICDSGHVEDILQVRDDFAEHVLWNLTPLHAIDLLERYGTSEVAKYLAQKGDFVISCFCAVLEKAEMSMPAKSRAVTNRFYFHLNIALQSATGKSPLFFHDSAGTLYRFAGSWARKRSTYSELMLSLEESVPSDMTAYFACKHEVEIETGDMTMPFLRRLWTGRSAFSSLRPETPYKSFLSFDPSPESAAMQDFYSWSVDTDLTCAPRGSFKKFNPRNSNKALVHTMAYAYTCTAYRRQTEALGYFVQMFCFYSHAEPSTFEDHATLGHLKMDMYLLGAITLSRFGHGLKDLALKFLVAAAGELKTSRWCGKDGQDARVAQFFVGVQEVFAGLGFNYSAAYVHSLVKALPSVCHSGTYFLKSCILNTGKKSEIILHCLAFLGSRIPEVLSKRSREEEVIANVAERALEAIDNTTILAEAAVGSQRSHPFYSEVKHMREAHELFSLLLRGLEGKLSQLCYKKKLLDVANDNPVGTSVHHMCLILLNSPEIGWHRQEIMRCSQVYRDMTATGLLSPHLKARTVYSLCVQLYVVGRLSTLAEDIFFDSLEGYIDELERDDPTNHLLPNIKYFEDLVFPPTDREPRSYTASTFLSKTKKYSYPNRLLFKCGCSGRPRSPQCRCFGHMAEQGRLFMQDTAASRLSDQQLGNELLGNRLVDDILSNLPRRQSGGQ